MIYAFLKFLEKRGIRNTISIISVYIYSLEMIIVNSENTSVTNRRCIRIVRTGETVYVYIIIFDLYVRNIWKASGIRLKAAWGVSKLLLTVVFFPVILIGMVFAGLIYLAFPILIIVGIVTLLSRN